MSHAEAGNSYKNSFGKPKYRWKENIRMDLRISAWTGFI
jgi:hypothetical protein